MNTSKTSYKNRLTALAAICSSFFLLAACEPQDDRPAESPTDPGAPSYGEPDRDADPAADPAAPADQQQQEEADPWEDDASQTN